MAQDLDAALELAILHLLFQMPLTL